MLETKIKLSRGGFSGEGIVGTRPPFFPRKKITHKQKIPKHNTIIIFQIEPRLKEMNYLMTVAETETTFSAFQFFHKHNWNNVSGKVIVAVSPVT